MLIGSVILFHLFLIFSFYCVGETIKKFKLHLTKSIIFGYSIFLVLNFFLYFIFKINTFYILIIWFLIFLFSIIIFFARPYKIKKNYFIYNFIIFLILLLSIIYILPSYYYGEQFYIFRGNHWDQFSYLSIGTLFSKYDFSILTNEQNFPFEFKHFKDINNLIYSRPLTSLLIGIYIRFFNIDIFLASYIFKITLILLSAISFRSLVDNFNYTNFNKNLLTIVFSISFWLLYIFEIDAYSHLAAIPIFLIIISESLNLKKFEHIDIFNICYFSILNSALFLIYPELFCVTLIIISVFFIEKLIRSKKKIFFIKNVFLILIVFLLITLPSFKTNYLFLLGQYSLALSDKNDWWGYFGSFVLGKENLVQNEYYINQIKSFFNQNNLIDTIKYIAKLHFIEGYSFFYLNIIPSLFGLYFISIGKVSNILDWINLTFLIGILIYILNISLKNIFEFIKNKKILFCCIPLLFLILFILIQGNLWALIKLYTFLSPFIFIFIVTRFSLKKNLKINYLIIFLLTLFPFYKFTSFNDGIGKLDSFPSIMHPDMKKEFKWKLEISEIKKNCDYIVYLDDDYFRKSYLILKFLNNSINSNLTSSENNDHLKICDLNVENNKFNIIY